MVGSRTKCMMMLKVMKNTDLFGGEAKASFTMPKMLIMSDEELPAEEEAEVLRLQKEKAESLSMADFGLEDDGQVESDLKPTFEDILVKGKDASKPSKDKGAQDEVGTTYEEVKKDLNALTREEQMDIVYSAAPELVGLLAELNDTVEQLENIVNPLLSKRRGDCQERREIFGAETTSFAVLLPSYYLLSSSRV